jgi:RNA polymerase sigma factor (sigma-70 family)
MRNTAGERELIDRMQAGDATAVADLSTVYGARIHQLAFRYMKNWEDAEEVTQDVLMKVFRKIDAFRGDAALSSWIYRITFNTAMSRLRTGRAGRAAEQQRPESGRSRLTPAALPRSPRTGPRSLTTTSCGVRCGSS